MDNVAVLDTEEYISSKRASEITGYAQDYIGQLARGGQIKARRIGGLWHVHKGSLLSHKNKSDEFKSVPPIYNERTSVSEADAFVNLDGKEYISANRASKITGYNQDYVGQLARNGKIMSRQIGNRWYVDKDALFIHKKEKDALLAAVQAESVGLQDPDPVIKDLSFDEPLLTYTVEKGDMMPTIAATGEALTSPEEGHSIPIRVIQTPGSVSSGVRDDSSGVHQNTRLRKLHSDRKTIIRAIFIRLALLVLAIPLIFLSFEGVSRYVVQGQGSSVTSAIGAVGGINSLLNALENILTAQLVYQRSQ